MFLIFGKINIMDIKEIKKVRMVENMINQRLFIICGFITLVTMGLTVVDFFSKGVFIPQRINFFYLGVLLIYSLHKELIRWLDQRKKSRNGEFFVYVWIILTTVLYVINFFSKDYYTHSAEGYELGVLRDASLLTLQVLAVFIITRSLKLFKIMLFK